MLIKDWMSSTVISIEANAPVSEAINLLAKNIISMLPVVSKGMLVGVISDTDLKPYNVPSSGIDHIYQRVLAVAFGDKGSGYHE